MLDRMSAAQRDIHDHDHGQSGHDHAHGGGRLTRLRRALRSATHHGASHHGHSQAAAGDAVVEASAEGMRALCLSLAVLAATAVLQAAVAAFSGSVALLGDTWHNAADALTAVPLAVAFLAGRRPPIRSYTYGYGRAEDLAGVVIVVIIAASSALTAYQAAARLAHPRPVGHLIAVAIAALTGFAGNELVAWYRIRTGRKIGSAALVADGPHARTEGLTSLAVLAGLGGVALGWDWADPVAGLLITVAILAVLRQAGREIWRRLMDAVDPDLTDRAEQAIRAAPGVLGAGQVPGCAGPATSCGPSARSPWGRTSRPCRPTRSRSVPSMRCGTPCRGCRRRWCTPIRSPALAPITTRCWPHTGSARWRLRPARSRCG
jgi:cation diffusion facilitator family transporter